LVTLGLVVDADGFPKKSGCFDGNVSEPATIKDMLSSLSHPSISKRPLIVLDAGCATEENLKWLKAKGYGYIPQGLEMVMLKEDNQRQIQGGLITNPDTHEIELHCHSTAKEIKEGGIRPDWTSIARRPFSGNGGKGSPNGTTFIMTSPPYRPTVSSTSISNTATTGTVRV
jgi:hypothetical protein